MERYPDLEIYALDVAFKDVEDWLQQNFKTVERSEVIGKKTKARIHFTVDGDEVVVFSSAVGKYASIWFKQNNSPWLTDLECARSACQALNTQIRCSNSGWEEGQKPDSQWWRVTQEEGEMLIEWPES